MGIVTLAIGLLLSGPSLAADPGWVHVGPAYSTITRDQVWFGLYNHGPYDLIALDYEEFTYTNYCIQTHFSGVAGTPPWTSPFTSLYSTAGVFPYSVNDSISPHTKRSYHLVYKFIGSPYSYFDPSTNRVITRDQEPALEGWNWLENTELEGLFDEPVSSYSRKAAKKWDFSVYIVDESLPELEDGDDGGGAGGDMGDLGGGAG